MESDKLINKIKNLKRSKRRMKNKLNKRIEQLENEIRELKWEKSWDLIDTETNDINTIDNKE